ncbi:nucleoside hydrolase [Parabacteroides timonensis]|uniref:nucleoside hydrolase n=1 Tax=Parabacteroides timonensis TaxID=1871013 RepID=UPI00094EBB1E|nr:nucleoside hydrolase [Parabacteroides timonensis]
MKKSWIYLLIGCLCFSGTIYGKTVKQTQNAPVKLILDTDLGPDYDDVGAMALLHALADSSQVSILATVASNRHDKVVPCIEVLNTYFGRPDIPLGVPKEENAPCLTSNHKVKWTEYLPAHYPHQMKRSSDAPDAVQIYRKILSEAADNSITICTIGFFTNLKNLLLSSGDTYSPLTGKELISQKVKRLVAMAGRFPKGREYNVYIDTPASITTFEEWPTEIIFSGFEIGEKVLTGKLVAQMVIDNNPVKDTYRLCLAEGDFNGRKSWDQTAVLVAVKGYEPYYHVERGTIKIVDDKGTNDWVPDDKGRHLRLIEKMPVTEITKLINNYMMHLPVSKR